jgi:S-adenosylmethionine:tRNA ribosyltransferase-isomerase
MQLSDFDYNLPPGRIAQEPLPDRAASRMLVVYRGEQRWDDRAFFLRACTDIGLACMP